MGNLDEAIKSYENSLIEISDYKVKNTLKKTQKLKRQKEERAYLDDGKSDEAKVRGNALFKNGKWADAIQEYTEAIKRNPKNHVACSNRAACYMKLMDWQRGLDDCNKCIKLDKTYVKAYIRKGRTQRFLKQYHKALSTFDEGLKYSPDDKSLLEDKQLTMQAVNRESASGNVDPQRAAEAMKDPEIKQILNDPVIKEVLRNAGGADPAAASRSMQDPEVRKKIDKLVAAGIVSVGKG
eukprot:TRINITY_DN1788_c0_g1_i1.p1 TRINITY_DN1788_c0_g1~~TRINITY_DN1788_c0_g1_i1.p1  ORF type:complete len:277 (-),score=80.29 TRINITY_DN1788_c0_g1_i1:85-798(-)